MNYMINELKISSYLPWALIVILLFFLPFCSEAGFQYKENMRNFISFSPNNPYFIVVVTCGSLLAIASFYFPRFGLIVMLFFILISTDMPLEKGTKAERTTSIRVEDIILVLVSIGWLFNRARTRTLSLFKNVPVNRAIIIMSCAMLISSFLGIIQETVSVQRAFFFTMKRLEYFWIFFMALNIMENDKEAKLSINLFILISGLVACIGIFQFFIFPVSEFVKGGATATVGFGRANTLADFYLIIIGIILGLAIYTKDKKTLIFYNIIFFLLFFALIMTKSRGAYVSVVPLLFIILYLSKSAKVFKLIAGGFLLGCLYLLSTAISIGDADLLIKKHNEDISGQFSSIKGVAEHGVESDSSLYARYTACRDLWPEILRYPIFGHGVGSLFLGYVDVQYFHEMYETGLAGILAFFYLNIIILFSVFYYYRYTDELFNKGLCLGFIGSHVGVLVHGLTITNFYTIINMEAFWFILAIIMLLYYNERKRRSIDKGNDNGSLPNFTP